MSVTNKINNANTLIVGANRGIGFGFVNKLLESQEYGKIYATYRDKPGAHAQSDRNCASDLIALAQKYPERLICLPMDVTDEQKIAEGTKFISESTDKLHLVINCVGLLHEGTLQPEKSLRQLNSENLLRYFQVNSISSALLAKHLLPLFRHDSPSVFACISAKIGSIGDNKLGGWYGYRASKAALNMFIRTVAIEYGRKSPNTLVVALHPGTTDTNLSKPFQRNVPPEKLFSVERTVNQLLAVINNLDKEDSGQFFSWDGSRLPW